MKLSDAYLQQFLDRIAGGSIHQLDWVVFYQFIRVAHRGRLKMLESDFRDFLVEKGIDEKDAYEYAKIYHHGRRLLATTVSEIRR